MFPGLNQQILKKLMFIEIFHIPNFNNIFFIFLIHEREQFMRQVSSIKSEDSRSPRVV